MNPSSSTLILDIINRHLIYMTYAYVYYMIYMTYIYIYLINSRVIQNLKLIFSITWFAIYNMYIFYNFDLKSFQNKIRLGSTLGTISLIDFVIENNLPVIRTKCFASLQMED